MLYPREALNFEYPEGAGMGKTTAAKAEARFKQLCCLGLGGEAVMPALIDELRALVPSITSTFFFADD